MGLKKPSTQIGLHEVIEREHTRDMPGLLQQLKDAEPGNRRWAARDLAPYPACAATLGEALLSERDTSVRTALFTTLAGFANADAVNALLPLLRTEDAGLRNGAIEALTEMPEAVAPRIQALLHDSDPDVRIFTVNLLAELRHEQVNTWLRHVLQQETAINVVAAAIEVMTEVGEPQDVPVLREAGARFDDPFVGFAADMAIERIEAA
jgi:HEAT repeat protein